MIIWKCGGNVIASLHSIKVKFILLIYLLNVKLGLQYFNFSSSRDINNLSEKRVTGNDHKIEWKKILRQILFLIRGKELSEK